MQGLGNNRFAVALVMTLHCLPKGGKINRKGTKEGAKRITGYSQKSPL